MAEMTFGQMRDEAKKQGFEPLPIGTYNFKVERADVKKGSGGNSQISTKIVVVDGPIAGRSTLNRLVFYKNDGDVNGMVYRQLKALGIGDDHPIWAQIDAVGLEQGVGSLAQLIVGAVFIGEIDHQVWNNETRDNVKNMKPYGSGGLVPTGVPTGVAGGAAVPVVPVPPAPASVPAPPPVPAPQPVQEEAQPQAPVAPVPMAAVTTAPEPVPAPAPVAPAPSPVPVPPVPADDPF